MDLKVLLIKVLEEYRRPIEISNLTKKVNDLCPTQTIRRKYIKQVLCSNEEFFLVDAYNGTNSKIWGLSSWPANLKSLSSYLDWETYEPVVGKVVVSIYHRLLDEAKEVQLEGLRNCIGRYRHNIDILKKVITYDPLFRINSEDYVSLAIDVIHDDYGLKTNYVNNGQLTLSEAIHIHEKVVCTTSVDEVVNAFLKRFDKSFAEEDIQMYCTVFGLTREAFYEALVTKTKIFSVCGKGFVSDKFKNLSELINYIKKVGVSLETVISDISNKLISSNGDLTKALLDLPYSEAMAKHLLFRQKYLIQITNSHWFPSLIVPDQLKTLSDFKKYLETDISVSIILSFREAQRCLTVQQVISRCSGATVTDNRIECIYNFFLELQNDYIYKVPNSEYWALREWEELINLNLIKSVEEWLDNDKDYADFLEIKNMLKNKGFEYEDQYIKNCINHWPDIYSMEQNGKKLYATRLDLDNNLIEKLKYLIIKKLEEVDSDGMLVSDLLLGISELAYQETIKVDKIMLRRILKNMGEVAVIKSKVYIQEKAPLESMRLGDVAYIIINEIGEPVPYSQLEAEVAARTNYSGSISSVLLCEPKLSRPSRGFYALREWGLGEYNPDIHKQIGELLYLIIQNEGRPLHKSEIRRQLRRRGITLNEMTLQMDLVEDPRISQVASGVYALSEWNLQFRDLFRYNLKFNLVAPVYGASSVYELNGGYIFEYMITKYCLEIGRIIIRRHMAKYFENIEEHHRVNIYDFDDKYYHGWIEKNNSGWQVMGIKRWLKTHKQRYGEIIYIYQKSNNPYDIVLYTSDEYELINSVC